MIYFKIKLLTYLLRGAPFGEPGRTPLYVGLPGLPSTWGSVDGDLIFFSFFVGGLLIGDPDRYK